MNLCCRLKIYLKKVCTVFQFILYDTILLYTVKQQESEVPAMQTTSITEHNATIFNIENWDGDFSIGKYKINILLSLKVTFARFFNIWFKFYKI